MSSRNWQLRVQDILDAITSIEQRTAGITFEQFAANETVVKSVLYDFIIIGEASANIPTEIQSRYDQIPWRLRCSHFYVFLGGATYQSRFNFDISSHTRSRYGINYYSKATNRGKITELLITNY